MHTHLEYIQQKLDAALSHNILAVLYVRARTRACVRACVRVRVHVRVHVRVRVSATRPTYRGGYMCEFIYEKTVM